MKSKLTILVAVVASVLGVSLSSYAGLMGYQTDEYAYKTSASDADSGVTGTNVFGVYYGAQCTQGSFSAHVMFYSNGSYYAYPSAYHTFSSGEQNYSLNASCPPYKLFILRLSGITGRGEGWIKGQ